MKIGIDLDDTICNTTEIVQEYLKKYSKNQKINSLDIMNDEDLKQTFFTKYLKEIYENAIIKPNASEVIKRIRNRGNKIYIITARRNDYVPTVSNVIEIIKEWLQKNNIEVDGIIISSHGERKAQMCEENNIDLMIDDNPYNYKKITELGKKCILFDDKERYDLKDNYVTNWLDVEKYIERNR